MMTIVIVGAGDVGQYIASLLSKEEHNIVLIDKNGKILQEATRYLDVATRHGSGTDWQLLDDLLELSPQLLIALTEDDEVNMVACCIAKHLGYPRTIARVRDNHFLNRMRLDFGRIFDVDYFIGPELLVAHEILKYMVSPGSIQVENFAQGAVQLRTLSIPARWNKGNVKLKDLALPAGAIVSLIRRFVPNEDNQIDETDFTLIFPHGDDVILPRDEVTLIGETPTITEIHHFFGIGSQVIKSIVIVGGSLTAINLARLLEYRPVDVKIIEKDFNTCAMLADTLPNCTIVHHDATDLDFLRSEKVGSSELLVACTRHDDTNLLCALLAQEAGCPNALIVINNTSYTPLLTTLGINYAVSPRISAANHILSQLFAGTISSLISLYDNQARVMEINVPIDSEVAGIPLSELGPLLPQDFLIVMIQNRGRIMVANGSRIISPGDTVIAITHAKHVPELQKIF
ncbi:MAG: Trk system potassium transporter TrkA [Parachlamydiales bacterium]|jgi:trk system potassium uptake protein TrkA